ncbi:MAG: YlxR family protein [Clostridia bacterium]|nr:YlxR family protein [Clostridia bacterium]
MAKKNAVPMRMCIACREMKPKKEMIRVVKNAGGEIFADFSGKAAGRGAYICNEETCLKKLSDKKLLHKAFSTDVAQEVYLGVKEELCGEK